MPKPHLTSTALLTALLAAVASLLLVGSGFTWIASLAGMVLLLIALSFDEEGYRTLFQSVAFAGVCALCVTVASIIPYQYIYGLPSPREPQLLNKWLPLTWAFATVLFWVIDRARMSSRATAPQPVAATLGSVLSPAPPRVTRIPEPMTETREEFEPQPAVARFEAPPPRLVRDETVIAAPPRVAAVPAVKLVDIYVHLTGESLNLMRSVQAEPLGRDYFRITDTMPENETWQFMPGQVVRCKKQNLSTGKAMVAVEEAPRAQ